MSVWYGAVFHRSRFVQWQTHIIECGSLPSTYSLPSSLILYPSSFSVDCVDSVKLMTSHLAPLCGFTCVKKNIILRLALKSMVLFMLNFCEVWYLVQCSLFLNHGYPTVLSEETLCFPLSTPCILGNELRLLDLAASAFTYWVISLVLIQLLVMWWSWLKG